MDCCCGCLTLRITLLTFVLVLSNRIDGATNTSLSGQQFIEFKIRDRPAESRKDKVTLRFKTWQAYGVLMYSCGLQGDFLLMEIRRGKLAYTGSFGSSDEVSGIHSIIHDIQYNDNKWHHVTLLRENGRVDITIDGNTKSKTPEGDFEQLDLDTSLFLGGIGSTQRLDTTCINNRDKMNFNGCLDDVKFNSNDLLYGANEGFTGYKVHGGPLPFTCRQTKQEIMAFHSENSLMQVKRNILTKDELSLSITMRTFEPNGHIFTHKTTDGAVLLNLIDGKLTFVMSFLALAVNDAARISSKIELNDGDWHKIHIVVKRNESQIIFNVDKEEEFFQFQSHFKLSVELGLFTSSIQFGGNTPKLPGLVMCFRELKIDGNLVKFHAGNIIKQRNIGKECKIKDLCFPNPCIHGSKCSQSRGQFKCDCSGTEYTGIRCGTCKYKRTCDELKASGETRSGEYKLCPNNERIFPAFCDMKTGATIIKHDLENNTLVKNGEVIGPPGRRLYYHTVNYKIDIKKIIDLTSISLQCKQYIRFDCYRSHLLYGVGRERHPHFKGARWVSRDSYYQHYWGGSTPEKRTCGCAEDGTCARDANGNVKDCNCDVADAKWRFDAGFLTRKESLPVQAVQFSKGPETYGDSFFTVGFLRCYGSVPRPTTLPPPTTPQPTHKIRPTLIDGRMFFNMSDGRIFVNTSKGLKPYNGTLPPNIIVESVSSETVDIISEPWLVTVVVVGSLLCFLLVSMVLLLFRNNIYNVLVKCLYGNNTSKPRIEIEDYNRYSTATEEESDWDIYRLSTTFPTSTPEPSYGPTDDESVAMRVRTLEDVRGKRRFKRLTGWGSRTASAPTVVGSSSKQSLHEKDNDSLCLPNMKLDTSHCSSKTNENYRRQYESVDTEPAYSTTATDGECDSVIDDSNSEFSHKSSNRSHASSMKESEYSVSLAKPSNGCAEKPASCENINGESDNSAERPNHCKGNAVPIASKINGTKVYSTTDAVKAYYPVLPINGYRQPAVRRAHPIEYGPHTVTMVNNNGVRCPRFVAVNRRPSAGGEAYIAKHPTIQERDEYSDEEMVTYENHRNSDGFYELYDHEDNGSPSSETRLLFDDASSREECVREADEQIKLLKKKVIEKATSADECT